MSMLRARPPVFRSLRLYSQCPEKPPLKLVAELRKLTEVSITKAREALAASNNDVSAALVWLQNDLAVSGAQKAAKVAHRTAGEGLVGASVLARGRARQRATAVCAPRSSSSTARRTLSHATLFFTPSCGRRPYRRLPRRTHRTRVRFWQQQQHLPRPARAAPRRAALSAEGPAPSPVTALSQGTVADAIRAASRSSARISCCNARRPSRTARSPRAE